MLDLIYIVSMRDIIVPHMQAAATQLLSAARDGDIATVRRLLTEGRMDENVTDEVGVSKILQVYDIIAWHICVHLTQATQAAGRCGV